MSDDPQVVTHRQTLLTFVWRVTFFQLPDENDQHQHRIDGQCLKNGAPAGKG